jgi:hypothetical protein
LPWEREREMTISFTLCKWGGGFLDEAGSMWEWGLSYVKVQKSGRLNLGMILHFVHV